MAGLGQLAAATLTTFLVLVIARAAFHKWTAFHETVGFAQGYAIAPRHMVPAIVRGLAGLEVLAVAALIVPLTRPAGGLLAAGLFAGYGGLMALALLRGRTEIDCGCGGVPQVVSPLTLARNALLTLAALIVAAIPVGALGAAGAAIALTAGLTLTAIYGVAEKLASHLPHIRQAG
ncbi:MauE/DoxX family redox-associated membrane protein [Celeribacter indicus]|uniref:Methylamine utilization protein MauE n=1 Tax=Celeribacter indicus TaxID=1208324 RepID=A0A0B5E6V0_9RHOB|nr:MauE/DoxX family redox-associated membrane protein [Celeribacter indicus]AJE48052.1 methylamine utilization protein MauE [Celeribacter indicus]SDW30978.1 Methylamine utilisation protein MauE [Celeribacter indicus]